MHFDIDKDNLLDDSEEGLLLDTCYSSLPDSLGGTISRDDDVEKDEAPYSTPHFLAYVKEKDEYIDIMLCSMDDLKMFLMPSQPLVCMAMISIIEPNLPLLTDIPRITAQVCYLGNHLKCIIEVLLIQDRDI